ncbi:unnamed protein product [Rotaria sp. Silwood1]|nr:unnamed protein product [Rotaria sp. Silwood1]CAF0854326.1 unnamed protein product [Rotaria sp. Silwood1]CAF0869890.1 unnamed protein product [Rotaria sp. Silwood1]
MIRDSVILLAEIDPLSKEIECIMCLNTVNDSRMCIHCSVIVCAKCIESWIDKQKSCPKCSHPVQQTDFVKCRLADKLVEFIEISKLNSCSNHSKETPRVYCSTCKTYVCFKCILIHGQHIDHEYKYIDENYKKIITLNHKLLGFIRKRCKNNQDNLAALELVIQTLLNDHSENIKHTNTCQQTTDLLIQETQHLFDDYQQKKQICIDVIKMDESIIKDIEQRLNESQSLSDQEEILQILQKHIPSTAE